MFAEKPFTHKPPRKGKKPGEPFATYEPEIPQESLVNVGGDFFATPDTPADPMDCDRYPDSPWCGGNPIDLENPVSLNIDIVQDECNFGIQFSGTLGFIKLPPFQVVYRNPDCQPPPLPPPPEFDDYEIDVPIPKGDGIFFLYSVSRLDIEHLEYADGTIGDYSSEVYSNISSLIFPYIGDIKIAASFNPKILVQPEWSLQFEVGFSVNFDKNYYEKSTNKPNGRQYIDSDNASFTVYGDSSTKNISLNTPIRPPLDPNVIRDQAIGSIRIFQNRLEMLAYFQYMAETGNPLKNYRRTTRENDSNSFRIKEGTLAFYGIPILADAPPPPKKKECDCMGCCPDISNQDALLKLILKRIGNLPANVPDSFTKQNPSNISIESLAELMLWQMQQLDGLMGAYPIEIEIEDSDLVKAGNQKQKIKLPNQAEAIAELMGLLLTVKRDTHATLITAIKAMGEAGMSKNLATKVLDVALANAEFLGYKLEQKKKEIPSLFTPGGKNITETLQEKNVEIITYENTDKKDLQDDLKTLLTMAARWNAQNWRKVGKNAALSLYDNLIGNVDITKNSDKVDDQQDFNDFTEQAERGFIDVTGISDATNPWDRPYKERPKIREIGTDKGRYDDKGET